MRSVSLNAAGLEEHENKLQHVKSILHLSDELRVLSAAPSNVSNTIEQLCRTAGRSYDALERLERNHAITENEIGLLRRNIECIGQLWCEWRSMCRIAYIYQGNKSEAERTVESIREVNQKLHSALAMIRFLENKLGEEETIGAAVEASERLFQRVKNMADGVIDVSEEALRDTVVEFGKFAHSVGLEKVFTQATKQVKRDNKTEVES